MKNKFMIKTALIGILLTASPVEAMGNAKVTFTSNNNIKVGETFTVTMNVTDINDTYDGIVSMGGNLSFDNTKLEYISSKEVNAPYQFQINESYGYKIAGLDFTLENGINNTTTVYEFTFKALEEGNTKVTLENAKLTDSQDYIDTTVISKNITIEKQEEPIVKEEIIEAKETPVVEAKNVRVKETPVIKEVISNETTKFEKTTEIKDEVTETKIEKETEIVNETKQVKEKETFIIKAQKLFNGFIENLKNLFR